MMRSLVFSLVLGAASLGGLAATPSTAQAQWVQSNYWRRPVYPAYNRGLPSYRYSYYYTPPRLAVTPGYYSYYDSPYLPGPTPVYVPPAVYVQPRRLWYNYYYGY